MSLIIAHRGASGDVPENTMEAFDRAWRDGADGIEIDIRLCADQEAVVSHDPTLFRTAGDRRFVRDITYGELSHIDIGSWRSPKWNSCRVPLLSDVLKKVPMGKKVFVEIKDDAQTLPVVSSVLNGFPRLLQHITFIGFDYKTMLAYRKSYPNNSVLWLIDSRLTPAEWTSSLIDLIIDRTKKAGFEGIDINFSTLVTSLIAPPLLDAGLQLHVWDVDNESNYREISNLGAISVTTNYPGLLRKQTSCPNL